MTVTPLPSGPARARPPGLRPALIRRRPAPHDVTAPGEAHDAAGLTVSFEVTLHGEHRFRDAAEVFDALRRVSDRLATATVDIRPVGTAPVGNAPVGITPMGTTPVGLAPGPVPAQAVSTLEASRQNSEPADQSEAAVVILADSRAVRVGEQTVAFTRIEFDLLLFLAQHPRRVFTRAQLLSSVWGFAHAGQRTVDVHVRRLRAKLPQTEPVTTIRGVGYRLSDEASVRVQHLS